MSLCSSSGLRLAPRDDLSQAVTRLLGRPVREEDAQAAKASSDQHRAAKRAGRRMLLTNRRLRWGREQTWRPPCAACARIRANVNV